MKTNSALESFQERIIPDKSEKGIVSIHLKRYLFAKDFCRDKQVLDAACGTGYGTFELSSAASRVFGVDLSDEAIEYARNRYKSEHIDFKKMNVCRLDYPGDSFDTVCSFETIEHVEKPAGFLGEVARVLKKEGIFLVSTPHVQKSTQKPENPFHYQEWNCDDFKQLLQHYFTDVRLFGQSRKQSFLHKCLQRLDILNLRKKMMPSVTKKISRLVGTASFAEMSLDDIEIAENNFTGALYTVAVCSKKKS